MWWLLLAAVVAKVLGTDDKPAPKTEQKDKGPWDFGKGSDEPPKRKLPGTNKPIPKVPGDKPADKPAAAQGGVTPGLANHVPYPGQLPSRVVQTAQAMLGKLQLGQVVRDSDPADRFPYVAYRKEPHGGGKVGVTAYVSKAFIDMGGGKFPLTDKDKKNPNDAGGATGKW